jgi:RsiW-degrading membrane proteinase PrsW (M82 family)
VRVGAVTGVGAIDGFHPKEMFSSLRHKHTEEEIEEYFITGTRTTTPTLAQIKAEWPHPWVFFKVFLSLILAYVVIAAGVIFFNNEKFIPALMIVGSFVIPISVLLFYYEMNITRNVSIYQIAKMVLLGGVISLIVSLFGYQWLGNLPIGGFLAGIVEEVGKVSALILVVRNMRYPWTLNGLLLGGAVGAGFAGIESAGYAFDALFGSNGQIDTGGVLMSILERGILAPGGHVAWAAMNGAALWRVKGNRPFEFSMLHDFRFLRVFLLTVVLHGLWDSSLIPGAGALLQYAVLTVVALVGVLGFVQDGIKQVQTAQQATVGQVGAAVSAATA